MWKRGQVSGFIGIALLVLVLFGLFYIQSDKYTQRHSPEEILHGSVRFYFESCQKNAFMTAKDMYGIHKDKEGAYEEFMDASMQECAQRHEFTDVVVEAGTPKSYITITDSAISAKTIFPVSVKTGSSKTSFDTLTYDYDLGSFSALPLNGDRVTTRDLSFGYSDYIEVFIPKGTLINYGQGSFVKISARDPYILEGFPSLVIGNRIFELSPGLKFSQPVTISIDYSKIGAETDDTDEGRFVLYTFDDVSNNWVKVDGSYAEKERKKVTGKVSHFSYYAVGEDMQVELKPGLVSGCTVQERINYLCGVPCDKTCSRYASRYKVERAELQELIRLRSSPEYDPGMKIEGSCNLEENCLRCPEVCGIAQKSSGAVASQETPAVEPAKQESVKPDSKQPDCTIQARVDYLCGKCNSGSEDDGIGPYNPSYPNCNIVWSFNRDELNALANARGAGIKTVQEAIGKGLNLQQAPCSCDVAEVAASQGVIGKPPEVAEKPSGEDKQVAAEATSTSAVVEAQQNKEAKEKSADEQSGGKEGASQAAEPAAEVGVQSESESDEPQIIVPVSFDIGASNKKRSIMAYKFGSGETSVLVVGGIHAGTEGNGVELAKKLKDYYEQNPGSVPSDVTLWIIPVVNPDGLYMKSRFNYNSVDLNRNWPTEDWSVDTYYTRNSIKKGGGGSAPLSEPETQALSSFVLGKNIDVIISFHSQAGTVDAGRKIIDGMREPIDLAEQIAQVYSRRAGYKYLEAGWPYYPITGSMQDWAAGNDIAAIDVEISTSTLPLNEAEANMKAFEDVLSFVSAYGDATVT
ncbi:hypothetical protein HYU15_01515 [Candidatus Woesearchaeota archaeon]|nr:hypothetical protein [Candidatus Woesearchaeota archaeon]